MSLWLCINSYLFVFFFDCFSITNLEVLTFLIIIQWSDVIQTYLIKPSLWVLTLEVSTPGLVGWHNLSNNFIIAINESLVCSFLTRTHLTAYPSPEFIMLYIDCFYILDFELSRSTLQVYPNRQRISRKLFAQRLNLVPLIFQRLRLEPHWWEFVPSKFCFNGEVILNLLLSEAELCSYDGNQSYL